MVPLPVVVVHQVPSFSCSPFSEKDIRSGLKVKVFRHFMIGLPSALKLVPLPIMVPSLIVVVAVHVTPSLAKPEDVMCFFPASYQMISRAVASPPCHFHA